MNSCTYLHTNNTILLFFQFCTKISVLCAGSGCVNKSCCRVDPPGADPPGADTPPRAGTPPEQTTPREQTPTPHPREADCSTRSTSGRYASYWNAFLFFIVLRQKICFVATKIIFNLFFNYLTVFVNIIIWKQSTYHDVAFNFNARRTCCLYVRYCFG